jgi:16S rRNA (cytosine967-C5)-methyltransferase
MRVLHRVDVDQAFASMALDAEIDRAIVESRDAALATEIVYGTLRVLPDLDSAIKAYISTDISKLDPLTRAALRTAVYQINHLGRVPVHAIVNDAVSFIREQRGPRLAGFVNAVLRKLVVNRPENPQPPQSLTIPAWLSSALADCLSPERLDSVTRSKPLPPPISLRVNTERISREKLAHLIQESIADVKVELGTLSPHSILIQGGGNPRRLPGYERGYFAVQEEGAQLVGLLTGARTGECVADVCAGHGGKTALLSSMVGSEGRITAIDIEQDKLERIYPELLRLGLENHQVDIEAIDISIGLGGLKAIYDRVLVDAPCTGIGTIHRRPDLLLRLTVNDSDRMKETQIAILEGAARLVRPKGRLIYAVCSPMDAEGGQVARVIEDKYSKLRRVLSDQRSLHFLYDADGVARIGPWNSDNSISSPDMYQIIQWEVG